MTFLVQKKGCLSKKAELKLQIVGVSCFLFLNFDSEIFETSRPISSQVKYFNKTVLILHSNLLNRICYAGKVARLSHLTHLDLHSNKFQLFPDEIFSMPLLKVLDLSFNEIRVVPDRIDQLTRIKHLSIEGNRIQSLPSSIGNLHTLEELRFDKNPVTHLPVTLGHLKQLKDISLPLSSIIFPPKDICDLGIPAILSFLRKAGRVTDEESAFAEVGELSSGMGRCQVYGEGGGWHQVAEDLNIHEEIVCRASESRVSSLNKLGRKEEEMKGKLEQFGKQRERGKLELGTTLRGRTKCVDGLICCLHQKQCVLRKDNQPQSSIKHPCETITLDPRERILGFSKYLFFTQKLVNYDVNPSLLLVLELIPLFCVLSF
ncbi:E3 ubiquitin-protein ligase LRSAM1 [Taenia solium]